MKKLLWLAVCLVATWQPLQAASVTFCNNSGTNVTFKLKRNNIDYWTPFSFTPAGECETSTMNTTIDGYNLTCILAVGSGGYVTLPDNTNIITGVAGANHVWTYGGPVTTYHKTITVPNITTSTIRVWFKQNGTLMSEQYIAPSARAVYTFNYDSSSDLLQWGFETTQMKPMYTDGGEFVLAITNLQSTVWELTNGVGQWQQGYSPYSNALPITTINGYDMTVGGPIDYTGLPAGTVKDSTMQAGFNVLAGKLNDQISILGAIEQNTAGGGGGETDMTDTIEAINGVKNAVNEATNRLGGLLGDIKHNQTNVNALGVSDVSTNQSTASGAGDGAFAGVTAGIGDITGAIGEPPSVLSGAGSSAAMSIPFVGGVSLNLDPEYIAPGAMGMVKTLISLVAWIAFALSVAELFYKTMGIYATAQTGGVPDLNFVGINAAGAAAAPIIAAAFIAVWVICFVGVAALIVVALSGFASAMADAAGIAPPAVTMYLVSATIPVTLLLSLAFARIGLQFSAAAAVGLAGSASRFLIGK